MQQQYEQNGQFNQYLQQPQYDMSPAPTADQKQQYGPPTQSPVQQQIGNQSNTVQIPNQFGSQQPIVITQGGKKKKKTGQKILNALIVLLAIILIVGIIALAIKQCKETKEQADAQKAAEETAKQDSELIASNGELCYASKDASNNTASNNLETVNQSKSQSATVGC